MPDEVSAVDTVTPGAVAMREDYFLKLADVADSVAADAGKFSDWQPAMDEWAKRNETARLENQKLCVKPLDDFCKRGGKQYGPYDPQRFREGLARVSAGFRGGAK